MNGATVKTFSLVTATVGLILLVAYFFIIPDTSAAEAKVGEPAPLFSLTDTNGQNRSLNDFRGKLVVLEWLNHDCPFVKKHYDSGNMQKLQEQYQEKGIAWLSVNSSAPGKQGHFPPDQANQLTTEKGAKPTAVLLDPEGQVGRLYGARTTPHLFIIDQNGTLVYQGAIDSISSTKKEDVASATNYVAVALDSLLAGQPVETAVTTPYGCSVKY